MILALILSTLNQLPKPEEAADDIRPVMTPLAFRHFPEPECMTARAVLHRRELESNAREEQIPSLVELLMHKIGVSPQISTLRDLQDTLIIRRLWHPLAANIPFYLHYQSRDFDPSRPKRNDVEPGPRVMYISRATLVIVPLHLLSQWCDEVMKHCHDLALSYLTVRGSEKLPRAQILASEYDVGNISYTCFVN